MNMHYKKSLSYLVLGLVFTTFVAQADDEQEDRKITFEEATKLAAQVKKSFPITVNEAVVKELNTFLADAGDRASMQKALVRMEKHRPVLEKKFKEHDLPLELMAIPIVESEYDNLPQSTEPHHSAGVWQFTPQTARRFDMKVGKGVDERMNVEKSTDAACRFLAEMNREFHNWELVILGYNVGEDKVENGIEKTESRDAWKLIKSGIQEDKNYLAKVIAAVIIINNPSVTK
jgi:membrane-bound lytic murein transglycosylase D